MFRVMAGLVLCVLATMPSAAAEWSYVSPALGRSPTGSKVKGTMEIDVGSVVPVDRSVKAWFKLTYKANIANPANAAKPIRREKLLYYHLCNEHKRALIQIVYEDASGATVYSASFVSNPPNFEDVTPGTTGEAWLKAACKIAAMKQKSSAKP